MTGPRTSSPAVASPVDPGLDTLFDTGTVPEPSTAAPTQGEGVGAAPAVSFTVFGTPIAQGSKRLGRHGPHPVILDSNDKVLRPWREAVKAAALAVTNGRTVFARGTPVRMDVVFYLRRPAGHYGTGRNARQLKPSAPRYPTGTPDVDKLIRSLTDAITDSGAWWDDSQVVMYGPTGKRYADRCQPGAVVRLWVAP